MAPTDPTDPTDPTAINDSATAADGATTSFTNMGNAAEQAGQLLNGMNGVQKMASSLLGNLGRELESAGIRLNNMSRLTEAQTKTFSLLSAAILGVRDSYQSMAGVDMGNFSTFAEQFEGIKKIVLENPAGKAAKELIDKTAQALAAAGKPIAEIQAVLKQGVSSFLDYAKGVFQSADNANRLQNAYIQLAARTGNLSEVLRAAGPHLERMNFLLDQQAQMMSDTEKATGLNSAQVEKYWSELGRIPGALTSVVQLSGQGSRSTSMLTAAIEMARGSGRNFEEVMDDLNLAFKDYGIVGEQALTFSARMTDVANKMKAPFDDVRNAIRGAADQFKMFANAGADAAKQSEAIARSMVDYGTALQSVGLSASNAIGVVQQMLGGVHDLRIEQKAFLSQQTGGPGGLMGGFQIEKMMREGQTDKVLDLAMKSMKQQFGGGRITTFDEASKSQSAATQYERQIRMVQQGPLGAFAKDRESAERLLDMMRARQEGRAGGPGLTQNILQDQMKTGVDIQKQTYTELTKISADINAIRRHADIGNRMFVQSAFTASAGTPTDRTRATGAQRRQRRQLSQFMKGHETAGGTDVQDYARDIDQGAGQARHMRIGMAKDVKELFKTLTKDMPDAAKSVIDGLRQAINVGDPAAIQRQADRLKADIATRKQNYERDKGRMSQQERDEALRQIANEQRAYDAGQQQLGIVNTIRGGGGTGRVVGVTGATGQRGAPVTAGRQVGDATIAAATFAPTAPPPIVGGAGGDARGQNIDVHVTGTFQLVHPDGTAQTVTPQLQVTSTGAGLRQ